MSRIIRFRRIFACFLAAVSPVPVVHAETTQTGYFACSAVASALPPKGTRLSAKPLDELIANLPGSVLNLKPPANQGLALKSTYAGSLYCQSPSLFETVNGVRKQVGVPVRFQGGEGSLCVDDRVQLVAVGPIPALLETARDVKDNSTDLDIALRTRSGWSAPCRLSVKTTLQYGITARFCDGNACPDLEKVSIEFVDARHVGDYVTRVPGASELSPKDQKKWAGMIQLANERQLIRDDLPTFGQESHDFAIRSFWEADRGFTPIKLGKDLLLGKFGTAGFGSRFGLSDLFAAYRLVDGHFQPVAGFQLGVVARSLVGFHIVDSP